MDKVRIGHRIGGGRLAFFLPMTIESWKWDYSLSLGSFEGDPDPDPVSESKTLEIQCKVVKSDGPGKAGFPVDVGVLFGPKQKEEERLKIRSVGALYTIRGGYEASILMPNDMLPVAITMLAANRWRFLEFACEKQVQRESEIIQYEFKLAPDPED
ncbi:hypothetical protein [Aminobacter niigataensis]|uniref:hypothetical protein n=1 Tax=Aminobacter niigataensis TaxID=83265 RepID=UPI00298EE967|nr:hypothetical protein [Aminobacter niigataensis]